MAASKVGYGACHVKSSKNRACTVCRTGLADLPRNLNSADHSASASALSARSSRGWRNSARNSAETQPSSAFSGSARSSRGSSNPADNSAKAQTLATAAVPARGSRGPSSSASQPRRFSWAPLQPFSADRGRGIPRTTRTPRRLRLGLGLVGSPGPVRVGFYC
mgnify:CR=1 FL=1